jgi:lysophospholipase L1-like esterase
MYIALGDSYAAGDGVPTEFDVTSGCKRSSNSYPLLVARHLGLHKSQHRDVSCSSAKIADLTGSQNTGSATEPPQLNALSAADTVITLDIGGNDLGWSGVIERCVRLDVLDVLAAKVFHKSDNSAQCRAAYTSNGTDEIQQKIRAVSVDLAAALRRIHALAPNARVLVVGYPDLLPTSDGGACALVLGITSADIGFLNNEELQLNRMLSSQAAAAGDGYVDTYTPSIGHDACAAQDIRWIEPLIPNAGATPLHPNAAGQRSIARAVERAIAATG